MILAPLQKLPNNVEDLGKSIAAKCFKKLPKVQKIANSGHTVHWCYWKLLRLSTQSAYFSIQLVTIGGTKQKLLKGQIVKA